MVAKFFLSYQISFFSKYYDVTLITNLKEQSRFLDWVPNNVKIINVPIEREIHIMKDLFALFLVAKYFYRNNFSLVHSVSPKAGILAMLAAYITRVPVRLHTFTGQVWATKSGVIKLIIRWLDRLINSLATLVLIDSHSQKDYLIDYNIVKKNTSIVLGEGSISGVDLNKFKPNKNIRKKLRDNLNTAKNITVFLFIGRLKKEKGVLDLAEAFSNLYKKNKNTALWIVGPDEDSLYTNLKKISGIKLIPFTNYPYKYMAASDILCLPSYREGFGNVIIEAAACGITSIGYDIYGLRDAIVDGKTGLLVPLKSVADLENAMIKLMNDIKLRHRLNRSALRRARSKFSQDILTGQLNDLYKDLLKKHSHK